MLNNYSHKILTDDYANYQENYSANSHRVTQKNVHIHMSTLGNMLTQLTVSPCRCIISTCPKVIFNNDIRKLGIDHANASSPHTEKKHKKLSGEFIQYD